MPKKKKEELLTDEAAASVASEQMPETDAADPTPKSEAEPVEAISEANQEQEQESEAAVEALLLAPAIEETMPESEAIMSAAEPTVEDLLFTEVLPAKGAEEELSELKKTEDEKPDEEKLLSASAVAKKVARPTRNSFYGLDLNKLDRNLSEEQQQEWNNIYASFRSKSIISGTTIGVDQYSFDILNHDTLEMDKKTLNSLIIIDYRVKVLIPESEIWLPGDERPGHVLRNMVGSQVDYVIRDIDREGECAIGSRSMALSAKRRFFSRNEHNIGELLKCRVMAVGAKRCTVECNGYDIHLSQRDLSYSAIADLREKYRPGQELTCMLKEYDKETGLIKISVKEANPNPFIGADNRHPLGSRRQAKISGKYAGGVFCTLPDDTVCLCHYSMQHEDADFRIGDSVIVLIRQHDYNRQLIYGRILAKW